MNPLESKKLKILCLHGFKQNSSLFKSKTAVLRKSIKDIAELVYVDAPHIVDETKGSASWWRASKDGKEYRGWEQTLEYLRSVFEKQGPFDGVLGFSQGAVLASLLCSLSSLNAEPSSNLSDYYKQTNYNFFKLKFALLFSGFQSRATIHQPLYPYNPLLLQDLVVNSCTCNSTGCESNHQNLESSTANETSSSSNNTSLSLSSSSSLSSPNTPPPSSSSASSIIPTQHYPLNKITTPSLQVWGKADELVASANCEALSQQFLNPETYVHEHGHLIPTSKSDIQIYKNFLSKFI
ncbi:hypothetical protein DICPUDRAFT_98320 [Dictyostelium purpureum]|uniref:Serine hydrolase domain-containing protein n=1 Tax=Dictyostelium purpureum TaxID=5786 RepID=F0ZPI1_DICPU|nr:uncharacterized protein DICPUDRAFT_98320 [Dictyostelium purpureum]EGC34127.1 hypothetical protein DICPUDRAFT_98320 [Dictyostelium purpureum]|eukprot:XP_003289325.1 hypothetical protein DICPUDRAFT_98320 [Dictyostelium purpureum]